MKNKLLIVGIVFLAMPSLSLGASLCDTETVSIVYINGILNSKIQADDDKDNLVTVLKRQNVNIDEDKVYLAHNPTHLSGLGDFAKAVMQARSPDGLVDDYDLHNILRDIHSKAKTQKIVLVGHSQGSFYTNAVYAYLTEHGIPEGAIAVVNSGTPASFVAGGGAYTTSETDKLINEVRSGLSAIGGNQPLPANVSFTLTPEQDAELLGGHAFSDIYLNYGDYLIASNIARAVDTLTTESVPEYVESGCFNPPGVTITTIGKQVMFIAADTALPIARNYSQLLAGVPKGSFTFVNTYIVNPVISMFTRTTPEETPPKPIPQEDGEGEAAPVQNTTPFIRTDEPTRDLAALEAQVQQANALVALLQAQVALWQQEQDRAREAACIANSIRGPWDNVGWIGDKPGCDDETPWIQKMFWAPIQGGGGGEAAATSSEPDCPPEPLGCMPDFVPDGGPSF